MSGEFILLLAVVAVLARPVCAQSAEALTPWQEPVLQLPGRTAPPPRPQESAEGKGPVTQLYRALRSVGLDASRVFHVREAVLERGELHLYLTDGTIGFTQDVEGHITGAYFAGEGEVLMRPPDLTERASLGLFSGLGVLDEHFSAAYLRSNGWLMSELKPFLRECEEPNAFFAEHDGQARELAGMDALRLLESFTEDAELAARDRFLHARLVTRLGTLDVYDDSQAEDQFKVARLSSNGRDFYFDWWMAFAGLEAQRQGAQRVIEPARSASAVPVEEFRIDTVLTPPEMLQADAELDVAAHNGGQRLLIFELSRWLQVSRVEVDGKEAEFLQNDALSGSELERIGNDLVTVVMPAPLKDGERHRLRFHYAGAVMQQAAPGLLYVGARGTWYPNRGIQMSRFDLSFHWPSVWTLVATGERTAFREQNGMSEGHWSFEQKVPVAGFNLGRFTRATAQAEGVRGDGVSDRIEVASYSAGVVEQSVAQAAPEKAAATNEAIARRSAQAIEKYSRWFGAYPFKSLSITQMPGMISQGWPTLVFLTSYAYLSAEERQQLRLSEFDNLMYDGFMQDHETAHQWWGDRVGWSGYRDQWLMEALASLSALMIMEEEHPQDAQKLLNDYRQQLLATNANGRRYADAGPVTLGFRLSSAVFPNAYVPVTYGRGLWLMVMLRDYFNDTDKEAGSAGNGRFLAALQEFGRRYERRTATTDDFRQVLEEFLPAQAKFEGKMSLRWFFDEWVRGSSVPKITVRREAVRHGTHGTVASFDLVQEECPESLVTAVPIFAELGDGKRIYLQRVFADGHETHLSLKVPAGTRRILVDPEQRLLRQDEIRG